MTVFGNVIFLRRNLKHTEVSKKSVRLKLPRSEVKKRSNTLVKYYDITERQPDEENSCGP